jgi:hypothetical protein
MLRSAFIVVFCVISSPAAAEFYTGNDLKAKLESWENQSSSTGINGAIGAGFVIGVFDVGDNLWWCGNQHITVGQVTAMVLKDLRANPATLHKAAYSLVFGTFSREFPCPQAQKKSAPAPSAQAKPAPKPKPAESPW